MAPRKASPATFTDTFIRNLKPDTKVYRHSEGRSGFGVLVHPGGTKTFIYRYKVEGKDAVLTLGTYPELSLAEARIRYGEAYKAVRRGEDPKPDRPVKKVEPVEEVITFNELADEYYTQWAQGNLCKEWSYSGRRTLKKYLLPDWGDRKVSEFRVRDAYRLVDRVASKVPGSARNLIKAASSMFAYGCRMEYCEYNPFKQNFAVHTPKITQCPRERVLSEEEIRYLWTAIDEGPGVPEIKRALKLILVTAQRPGEVAGMKHSEIEDRWWTIPPERIKTENMLRRGGRTPRPHVVYLTATALALVGKPGASGDIVFGSLSNHKHSTEVRSQVHPVRVDSMNRRVSRSDSKKQPYYGLPQWQPHDLRRTASTMMHSLGIDFRHVEAVLNHSLGIVERTYNRYQYDEEKKTALLRWEDKLLSIIG